MLKGFRDFVMRGDVITVAVGLVVALAFSTLVKAFTDSVINPLVAAAQPHTTYGLGVQLGQAGNKSTFVDFGAFIGAIFLGVLQDGLNLKGVSANYFYFYLGLAILIVAVIVVALSNSV